MVAHSPNSVVPSPSFLSHPLQAPVIWQGRQAGPAGRAADGLFDDKISYRIRGSETAVSTAYKLLLAKKLVRCKMSVGQNSSEYVTVENPCRRSNVPQSYVAFKWCQNNRINDFPTDKNHTNTLHLFCSHVMCNMILQ